jgi:4-hydroxyacetophenone monooxygenase
MAVNREVDAAVDERRLAAGVQVANVPTLLLLLVQMTGDTKWLDGPYLPSRSRGIEDNDTGGLPQEIQEEIREAALNAIVEWRHGKPFAISKPTTELIARMMTVSMGEMVPLEYAAMIADQLGFRDQPDQGVVNPTGPVNFRALIIGAGASGIAAAVNLQKAGIQYEILEKHHDVGGTWLVNHYPGCGVDTPNYLYSYSFAKHDWSQYFASRDELKQYLDDVVTDFGVRENIRFGMNVVQAEFDRDSQGWLVEAVSENGESEKLFANIIISAVGAFDRPKLPSIPGLEDFKGPVVHTADWDDQLELAGKKVAVIGNGASAMQLVPAVAGIAESIVVFQRSPQWAAPFEKLQVGVPDDLRYLLATVAPYQAWYRARLGWIFNDRVHASLQKDPEWTNPERSVNAVNDGHREFFTRYLVSEIGDRTDLLEKVLPHYPPFGKRMLLDNGWFRTLALPEVTLITAPIERVESDRIMTSEGEQFEVDIIIAATGFDVVNFLAPMEIRGVSGIALREAWDGDDARAFLGLTIPDYPNFFCLYGPNTQAGHGGSLLLMVEAQIHYMMSILRQMFSRGLGTVEVRRDIFDDYNRRVDEAHANMVWTHEGMSVYYRNSRGRVVVNNPFRVVDFWKMTRDADLAQYLVEPSRAQTTKPKLTT